MEREGEGERIMKCNKNVNIPYCGEYLLVDNG